ncbi:CCA tRNA nucleotidyltransferase [Cyanobium sp. AMD-g]|uniref:CCA tRNA nucleotidyltransferase n=1 Tax=Cyanobium sp. AMD-g TaxID=2823699 RepID=UPI0020CFBC99|nr:CCA tRNA nucleotidyltransferase [Cyanobium sp. AMD-g]
MACEPGRQVSELWLALAPERWPVAPDRFPAGSALVGGAVRDGLLGRLAAQPDLDLVVPGDAMDLARQLGRRYGGTCVVLDQERSIARLVLEGWTIDLARCGGGDLAADLGRRDYTVNAIALPLQGAVVSSNEAADLRLIDPCGGLADLAARRMVAISEANLLDDPLRLLRGVRLACDLDFAIAPATWELIRRHCQRITAVAGERVLAELERLAASGQGHQGLAQALEAGLLQPWGGADGSAVSLQPLGPERPECCGLTPDEAAWALPLARLAAVLDGPTLDRLRASRRLQQRCQRLRQWLDCLRQTPGDTGALKLEALAETERLALQRQLEEELPALLLHLDPAAAQLALRRWRDPTDRLFHPRPPLDGRRLQQLLTIAPGPRLGQLIDHLTAEWAFGRLGGTAATETAELADQALAEAAVVAAQAWLVRQGEAKEADPRRD